MAANIFEGQRKVATAKSPSVASLADALAENERLAAMVANKIEAAKRQRSDALLAGDDALAKAKKAISEAEEEAEICAAWRVKLETLHAEAQDRDEQKRRQAVYDAAAEKVTAAASFGKLYAAAGRAMAEAMVILLEGQIAAAAANRELPKGATALPDPETAFTIVVAGEPKKIIRQEECTVWCRPGTYSPVRGAVQADPRYPKTGRAANGFPVDLQTFLRRECLPEVAVVYRSQVAPDLKIPGFVEPPIRGMYGEFDAPTYLAAIRQMLADLDDAPPAPVKRRPDVEMVPVDRDGVVEEGSAVRGAATLLNSGFSEEHMTFKTKAAAA